MAVGKQHHHTVNTDTQTGGWRQTVLQCGDIVFVVEHRFVVASIFGIHLLQETLSLIFRIVQLGEAITDFTTANEELKAIGDFRVLVVTTGQRRDFSRIFSDEGRLNQMRFSGLFKDFGYDTAQTPAFLNLDVQ